MRSSFVPSSHSVHIPADRTALVLLIVRTYALYGRSTRILVLLLIVGTLGVGISIVWAAPLSPAAQKLTPRPMQWGILGVKLTEAGASTGCRTAISHHMCAPPICSQRPGINLTFVPLQFCRGHRESAAAPGAAICGTYPEPRHQRRMGRHGHF